MNKILNVVLSILMLGVFVLSIWYTGDRLYSLFDFSSYWMVLVIVAVGVIGSLVTVGATVKSENRIVSVLNIIGGYVLTFFIYLFISLAALDIIQFVWEPSLAWSGITVLTISLIITVAGISLGASFKVKESEIQIPRLEKKITVMHITDVHLGHHRGKDYLEEIVKTTNQRNPDLVLITGDLIDASTALQPGVLEPLSTFNAPVYFVGGNHEEYVDNNRALKLIEEQSVRILHNEVIETHGIQLVGLDYMNADEETFDMHPSDKTDTIRSVLANISLNKGMPSVLMHHSPVGAKYADKAGINLMIAGHTHAGQIFPGTLLANLIFPYSRGIHQHGKTKVFVSEGAGTYMTRSRLGSSNEINLLHLVPAE